MSDVVTVHCSYCYKEISAKYNKAGLIENSDFKLCGSHVLCGACHAIEVESLKERKRNRSWRVQIYRYADRVFMERVLRKKINSNSKLYLALDKIYSGSEIYRLDLDHNEEDIIVGYLEVAYPQGWSYYPGDVCPHGTYVGGCGVDWMCGPCEDGLGTYVEVHYPKTVKVINKVAERIFGY